MAEAGPFNLSHIHFAMVEPTRRVSVAELRDAFFDEPRVALIGRRMVWWRSTPSSS